VTELEYFVLCSESALSKIWDNPEEDYAWKHLETPGGNGMWYNRYMCNCGEIHDRTLPSKPGIRQPQVLCTKCKKKMTYVMKVKKERTRRPEQANTTFAQNDVHIVAMAVVKDAIRYMDNGKQEGYYCHYCDGGLSHKEKYVEHEKNCPYLIAKDLLTGIEQDVRWANRCSYER
jgi:hypothetical protein